MRAFVAVEVESDKLNKLQEQFDINGVKLTNNFHLTLKFFKEINEDNIEKVKTALKSIKFKSFDLELTSLGTYPGGDYVRVIWVGVKSADLVNLHKEVEDKLSGMFEKDLRFSEHITLGRVKFVSDKKLLLDRIKDAKVESETFKIKEFKLIKSTLEIEGPIYEDLAVFKLD